MVALYILLSLIVLVWMVIVVVQLLSIRYIGLAQLRYLKAIKDELIYAEHHRR